MKQSQSSDPRPRAIRLFEVVFLAAMMLYPLIIAAGLPAEARFAPLADGVLLVAMIGAQLTAMVLVARKRQAWGRWLICALLLLDFAMYAALLSETAFESDAFIALSLFQFLLHGMAVFLVFTSGASRWLTGRATS